ncbi:thiamine/thiamine pyrophosphate ABC transporter permease [Utexia brackfieldae]|uniref:thiamine/thiamine pyrophosphate ABC transporter permease n=1 Tax=Utexia brackfieldae TaxID=3074108 RepID=UPI00370DD5CA
MAKQRQRLGDILPGLLSASTILTILCLAILSLWFFADNQIDLDFLSNPELWRVFRFTVWQALLSALLAIGFALILAKACYPLQFLGKRLLLRLYAVTFVLPTLVLIIGLPQVYGRQGWLATVWMWFGFDYTFSIYGLSGILIAHLFYNLPFAFRLFYQSLDSIAIEQRQLSAQLGLSYWQRFRYLEWPVLNRQLLPTFALVFMLCFTSFAIVLTLGGGPQNTSFEVAIYQALRDFEIGQAVILSFIQLLFCVSFMLLLRRLASPVAPISISNHRQFREFNHPAARWMSAVITVIASLFILSPMLAVIVNGIKAFSLALLTSALLKSTITSLLIAIGSACFALLLTLSLLWTTSRLQFSGRYRLSDLLMLSGSLILAIPGMVLAAGFFLLFYGLHDSALMIGGLMIISNGLMALPFTLKTLENPVNDLTHRYTLLAQSLNIQGKNYFYWIEFKALKSIFLFAFAFACVMSIGDFGMISLFGSQDFATLPFYLYQQLGAYRNQAADFTALVLLVLCFGIFYLIERWANKYD